MSASKLLTLSLQLQANAVVCNGITAPLKHHRAALFLERLIAAHG